MCLWPGYHLHQNTTKHGYSGVMKELKRVEWRCVVFSDDLGSVCVRVMDVHLYSVDLVTIIFWSAFTYDIQAPPQALWCEGPWIRTYSHIWCFCRVNGARYIAQVVPLLLPFLQQEDVLFSRTTHVHIWLLWCNILFVGYNNCPGQQDPQISRQLNTYGISNQSS